ncbi:hypothetical protein AV530_009450 [Patagioenas fasciata monilis]|uniref:Uncharacterized protein n=1 Tax=Patagioenas fasciata monilis TaxID=372326 RepID=A0A1V4JVW3_PATFA|nr:hypothetical protein AV530_009450 [Patagioenas fasciata monilis]
MSDSLRSSSEKESLHSTQDLEGKPKRKSFKTKDSALDLLSGSAATNCRIHCLKERLAQRSLLLLLSFLLCVQGSCFPREEASAAVR